jgi:hypothetical protein
VTTGSPSMHSNSLPHSFAPIGDIRQAILSVARVEDHAERAGFRRGRFRKWHCGVHTDKNPSCSIVRGPRIKCWACDESWNVIDLEMLATGQPFMQALRALAGEYGLRMSSEAYNPSVAKQRALDWRESQERAFNWRAGFLELADEILEEEKANLFDPSGGPTNESLILSLSRAERIIREAQSNRFLVRIFEIFSQVMPGLAKALADYGERLRFERQAVLTAFVELLAESEADRW